MRAPTSLTVADEAREGAFGICRALRKRDAPLELFHAENNFVAGLA